MAKVFPDGWRELTATGAAGRELQTLARLAAGLADNYTVYHDVHWAQVERGSYGSIREQARSHNRRSRSSLTPAPRT